MRDGDGRMPFVHIESYNGDLEKKLNRWELKNPKASIKFISHGVGKIGPKIYHSCIIKIK